MKIKGTTTPKKLTENGNWKCNHFANQKTAKMKSIKLLAGAFLVIITVQTNAQIFGNDPAIEIDGLPPESAWQIAEMAMKDNSINIEKFALKEGVLISDWIEWTAIAIKNHAHLYLKYEPPVMTLRISDRQYRSSEGWSEAIGNLSKKKYREYVQNVADRIEEIKDDTELTKSAIKNSKLILAFNPVFTVEGLEFKLMKTSKNENQHLSLEFAVHNTTPEEAKVRIPLHGFKDEVNPKITGSRGDVEWIPRAGLEAAIQPDETRSLICEIDNWEMSTLPEFDIRVIRNSGELHKISMFSIPLSYVYTESD